ncbi:hypothetical protein JDV02_005071 [Purpureocillium takamizusanense]|uniref:Uncharacterized protein n=1 Tax=Purpureocillium takamizusanense TaxID=2060973 RepID=A0A9Q8QFS3_9HYPO|nr:uncharacterized protein JDV02_005071 [Purpureocillium takamizusanense]UNI18825.1 hypothetical protein JDV02_005071 [Purpureocillium takamizusanense]
MKVELFDTDSGSFMKYGYIVMREPDYWLDCSGEYLDWLEEFKRRAREAGLLEYFSENIARPTKEGAQQTEFDQKQAAVNNFILKMLQLPDWDDSTKESWQDDLRNTQEFDKTPTSILLERIKESLDVDESIRDFVMANKRPLGRQYAAGELNHEWDNIKMVSAHTPDHVYHFGAWRLACDLDLPKVQGLYAESLPGMPSIEAVKKALEDDR